MRPLAALAVALGLGLGLGLGLASRSASQPVVPTLDFAIAEPLAANWPAVPVRVFSGHGPLEQYARSPAEAYGLYRVMVPPGRPLLLVIRSRDPGALTARIFDAPPWRAPQLAQPLPLEIRRMGPERLGGVWFSARPGACGGLFYILLSLGDANAWPAASAELYDPLLPYPAPPLIRVWGRAEPTDIATPLERETRRTAGEVLQTPDCSDRDIYGFQAPWRTP